MLKVGKTTKYTTGRAQGESISSFLTRFANEVRTIDGVCIIVTAGPMLTIDERVVEKCLETLNVTALENSCDSDGKDSLPPPQDAVDASKHPEKLEYEFLRDPAETDGRFMTRVLNYVSKYGLQVKRTNVFCQDRSRSMRGNIRDIEIIYLNYKDVP